MIPDKCQRKGCDQPAAWTFTFEASVVGYDGPPLEGMVAVYVCRKHATVETSEEMQPRIIEIIEELATRAGVSPTSFRCRWQRVR